MARAELERLTVDKFKGYSQPGTLEVKPVTVLVGSNNSGKSSLIQALLLLKQTLVDPRPEVSLLLSGPFVDGGSFSDLVSGWPEERGHFDLELTWSSTVELNRAFGEKWPDLGNLKKLSGVSWIKRDTFEQRLRTRLRLRFASGATRQTHSLSWLSLSSQLIVDGSSRGAQNPGFEYSGLALWNGEELDQSKVSVELDHFIPSLLMNRAELGPRDKHRSYYYGFRVLYQQPLEDLRELLRSFTYLDANRPRPTSLYSPATAPPVALGASGEFAAEMLHARQTDNVCFLPPLQVTPSSAEADKDVRALPLLEAVNAVMESLGVQQKLELRDIENVGFRLMFGEANAPHVGRGLLYLLPTVLLGLIGDPLRYSKDAVPQPLAEYLGKCQRFSHAAIEEAEIHLHPKIQSRLAHWLVALGMAGRRLLVETHSDHLVRRLRGLIARAGRNSQLEEWLLENVVVAEVNQDAVGNSTVRCSRLTASGKLEHWPEGFMDESVDEEREIYAAGLSKVPQAAPPAADTEFVETPEE